MRAAIVGAPGTPYYDGLFFFDIFLPLEYPYEPPVSFPVIFQLQSMQETIVHLYMLTTQKRTTILYLDRILFCYCDIKSYAVGALQFWRTAHQPKLV